MPMLPALDLSDDEDDQCVIVRLIMRSAQQCLPSLHDASARLAFVSFLNTPFPCELVSVGDSLNERVEYVTMLARWYVVADRPAIVRECFERLLLHMTTISSWVQKTAMPHAQAARLLTALVGPHVVHDVDGFRQLEFTLPDYSELWSDARTAKENIDYLVNATQRTRNVATSSGGGTSASGGSSATALTTGTAARELSDLEAQMTSLYSDSPESSIYQAIELVMHSACVPAIRWAMGKVGLGDLPAVFRNHASSAPARFDEYVVDSIKHTDDGELDPDLMLLTAAHFYKSKGSDKRSFFIKLQQGKLTQISWDKEFVHVIASLMDDEATVFASMRDVYVDAERREMHETYVGRLLDCLGKRTSATYSLRAIYAVWKPIYSTAKRSGSGLAEDALGEIGRLMDTVFLATELDMVASLSHGAAWSSSLIEDTGPIDIFSEWAKEMNEAKLHTKRFKHASQVHIPQ
jgi:hypothetical protein